MLAILAKHDAHATFFVIGERARESPDVVQQVRAAGHEIGNHSWSIHGVSRRTDEEFLENVRRTEAQLGLEGADKLYRPPGGRIRQDQIERLRARGYRCVLGSAYPYDGNHTPSWYIRWLTAKNLAPGAIVILHDGIPDPTRMIEALDAILTAGEAKGLRFVSVGELLQKARH